MADQYCRTPSQIVMYTTQLCSDCRRAKAYFDANHIPYMQISIEGDDEATRFVTEVNHGYHSVPTIIFPDGAVLVEPSWEDLRKQFHR